ncbi:MAG TPA: outer membrane beta-barrel protein [Bryobacteraceae bacterium]|nr:outer membrane beta-barrel protein [Bryobacteraceae bacterium]
MKNLLNGCLLFACISGLATLPLAAQETENGLFTFSAGAGFTTPVYHAGTQLDDGWNVDARAGINLFAAHLGLVGDFQFNDMGVNSTTLSNVGFPGGSTYIWDFSADPIIRFTPQSRLDFYLIGGPGIYHRTVDFTVPTVATFTGFDPFLGVFYPVGVPANIVVSSYSETRFGVNGGAGFDFGLTRGGRAKFFAEARYNVMFTGLRTAYVPVTFGFRW